MAHAIYGDITLTSPAMVDASGHPLTSFHVGQQIGVESALTNHGQTKQNCTYLVQVLDSEGVVEFFEGTSAPLLGNQSFTFSQMWIPTSAGKYTIQVFVWDSLSSAIPLTNMIQTKITVEQ